MADNDKIRHPEPELTAKNIVPTKEFGLLKVLEFPDGTSIHINTKKGEENMRVYHSSGSYHEFRTDGTHINYSSNNVVQYQKGGATITWDNNMDVKGDGHSRISISHDAHIEVGKDASIAVNGRGDVHSTGHIKLSAADIQLSTTEGSLVFASARDIELKADGGRVLIHSKNATQITSESGDIHVETDSGDIIQKSAGKHHVEAQGNIEAKAQGDVKTQGMGSISFDAGDVISIGGKSHVIKSDTGTTLETSSIPPGGKVKNEVPSV